MSEKSEIEMVEVTLQIPKQILDFLRSAEDALEETAEEYMARNILDTIEADLEAEGGNIFSFTGEQCIKIQSSPSLRQRQDHGSTLMHTMGVMQTCNQKRFA